MIRHETRDTRCKESVVSSQQSTVNSQQSTVKKKDNIFLFSFLTFLAWNSLTTWWVWNSTPAGSIAMILLNSTFMATTFWLYHITRKKIFHNKDGFFLLILFFLAFENLHLTWQLNWPWLNIGNVFSHNHTWVQWYEFTGTAGGTIWVLLANILAYRVIKRLQALVPEPVEGKNQDLGTSTSSVTEQNPHTINSSNPHTLSSSVPQFLSSSTPQLLLFLAVVLVPIIASKIMYHSYEEKGEDCLPLQ